MCEYVCAIDEHNIIIIIKNRNNKERMRGDYSLYGHDHGYPIKIMFTTGRTDRIDHCDCPETAGDNIRIDMHLCSHAHTLATSRMLIKFDWSSGPIPEHTRLLYHFHRNARIATNIQCASELERFAFDTWEMCTTLNVAFERKVIWFIFIFIFAVVVVVGVVVIFVGRMCEFVARMLCTYWRASLSLLESETECHYDPNWHRAVLVCVYVYERAWTERREHISESLQQNGPEIINAIFGQGLYRTQRKRKGKPKEEKIHEKSFRIYFHVLRSLQFHWNDKRSGRTLDGRRRRRYCFHFIFAAHGILCSPCAVRHSFDSLQYLSIYARRVLHLSMLLIF